MQETLTPTRRRLALPIFIACAYGLAWLVALPLWLGDGLNSPWFMVVTIAMMFTPAVAALVAVLVERPQKKARALGLVPLQPVGRLLRHLALGLVVPIVVCLAALPIGHLAGVFPADFTGLSGFQQITEQQLAQAGVDELPLPIETLAALQIINVLVAALVINLLPALGEEIGWRGWMLPKLLRFGPWGAIGISGIIWGLWHAPLILLGYNYPGTPGWLALIAMVALCTIMGGVFGWLRLRSGSVWPAALAHSTFNAAATTYLLFIAADATFDPLQATITGWTGWILPAVVVLLVVLTGRFSPVSQETAGDLPRDDQ
ncbi:CPBP family glutamic-type intramembrane protease [Nesterenkonia xinjiangensis]|uniref:Membrane protease YdiL (CAAX protease family) n=1 Tax=Nesterenkonia xinjiangensis TaxID=225327 RepID=A0A7Z0K7Y7_9MICC|nr:membrane protease YdiL (CAAX protease family) [Nesterenkonia xinjiangensis]